MRNRKQIISSFAIALLVFASCVPLKEFSELKDTSEKYRNTNQLLKEENEDLTVEKNELEGKYSQAYRQLVDLTDRVAKLEKENNDLRYEKEKLQQLKEDYEKQVNSLKQGSSEEISELLSELQKLQNDLQEREDRVRKAEQQLKQKQEELGVAQQQLSEQQQQLANQKQQLGDAEKELAEKEARLMELQDALDKQKNAVTQLKDKLYGALKGFYDQGLRVHEKNGKVYVSMDEKLLFKTGSYSLGPQGEQALAAIADILASNADVNVMIEGHTDDVPLNGTSQIKDNWDLSVMRATAVTKILLNNSSIDPQRIIAAGRSEYVPLESEKTPEARKKNRRTEIILTPDLSKILNILESN